MQYLQPETDTFRIALTTRLAFYLLVTKGHLTQSTYFKADDLKIYPKSVKWFREQNMLSFFVTFAMNT